MKSLVFKLQFAGGSVLKKFSQSREYSGIVLISAFIIYALLFGLVLGSMWGLKPSESLRIPHGRIDYWIHRYQTLIGSLFVLLPLAVAIDQMRESRRQHEQNARLPFLSELSAMNHAEAIAQRYIDAPRWAAKFLQSYMGRQPEPTQAEIDGLASDLDPTVGYALKLLGDALAGKTIPKPTGGTFANLAQSLAASFGPLETPKDADKRFAAEKLKNAIEARRSFLRLFITGI